MARVSGVCPKTQLNHSFVSIVLFLLALYFIASSALRSATIAHSINFANEDKESSRVSIEIPGNSVSKPSKDGLQRTLDEVSEALVVASLKNDDISWLYDFLPDWAPNVYVVDDPDAMLTVAKNKGRESSVYLTYLIDNYDNLPDYMVFLHALRYQWHNEDPMYDGVPMIQNLRLFHVELEGYANLRCTWTLGCPDEIKPAQAGKSDGSAETNDAFPEAFAILFPGEEMPSEVGVHCGARFALSRAKVLQRPKADYERYRNWLWETSLPDGVSGRVLEYCWHMIMGKPAVHCPTAAECFCEKYGLCDLTCTEPGACLKRYRLPQYATIPKGWPENGPGENGWPANGWWE